VSLEPTATTDDAWVAWGEKDPYFAVITSPEFRRGAMDGQALAKFFEMGERHARYVLDMCRRRVDPGFKPRSALDFGCGVGRVTLPLAREVEHAVGVDIAPGMLAEAEANAQRLGIGNVEWVRSDDGLTGVRSQFDLVHSAIVFQHIDVARGRRLFQRLLECLAPGGIAALQITYAKAYHPDTYGQPPAPPPPPAGGPTPAGWLARWRQLPSRLAAGEAAPPPADPEMQMNPYNLTELAFMMQSAGIQDFHTTFTDHGGEWGVFLFFQRPRAKG
jgi:SAM-dependent methyltransferase